MAKWDTAICTQGSRHCERPVRRSTQREGGSEAISATHSSLDYRPPVEFEQNRGYWSSGTHISPQNQLGTAQPVSSFRVSPPGCSPIVDFVESHCSLQWDGRAPRSMPKTNGAVTGAKYWQNGRTNPTEKTERI